MTTDWTIDGGDAGRGRVSHHAPPRFTALWTSGAEDLAGIDGLCWTREGSAAEDSLHIFGFQWTDPAPPQTDFEHLMSRAATALDEWIVARL